MYVLNVKSDEVRKIPGFMARLLFPSAYKEITAIGALVAASVSLDWTIVRIIAPNDKPAKGAVKVTFGQERINFSVSRKDIAAFILNQIVDRTYLHRMPIIGS